MVYTFRLCSSLGQDVIVSFSQYDKYVLINLKRSNNVVPSDMILRIALVGEKGNGPNVKSALCIPSIRLLFVGYMYSKICH